mgnify:CR=1 FL=1
MSKKKKYSPVFKTKVELLVIMEEGTLSELSARYVVNANMISKWKKQLCRICNYGVEILNYLHIFSLSSQWKKFITIRIIIIVISKLTFFNHMQEFYSCNRFGGTPKAFEAKHQPNSFLYKSMIAFYPIVEIFFCLISIWFSSDNDLLIEFKAEILEPLLSLFALSIKSMVSSYLSTALYKYTHLPLTII